MYRFWQLKCLLKETERKITACFPGKNMVCIIASNHEYCASRIVLVESVKPLLGQVKGSFHLFFCTPMPSL